MEKEAWTLQHVFRNNPYEVWGFILGVPAFLTFAILAWKSAAALEHRGWKRILFSFAVISFVIALFIEQRPYRSDLQNITEGIVGGIILSTATVAIPQLTFAFYRWIRSGFDGAR
jgi:hypothetical protein